MYLSVLGTIFGIRYEMNGTVDVFNFSLLKIIEIGGWEQSYILGYIEKIV